MNRSELLYYHLVIVEYIGEYYYIVITHNIVHKYKANKINTKLIYDNYYAKCVHL